MNLQVSLIIMLAKPFGFLIIIITSFSCSPPTESDKKPEEAVKMNLEPVEESKRMQNPREHVPRGWVIIGEASGDLNGDNTEDVALVIQNTDPKYMVLNHSGMGEDSIDANPRALLILFGNAESLTYRLALRSDSVILRNDDPIMQDPFSEIAINNGNLEIGFISFANAGSWYSYYNKYIFRYRQGEFALIGAETGENHRSSGEYKDISINFLTNKYKITTGNFADSTVKPVTIWKKLKPTELKSLLNFTPLKQQINSDIYL